jgi:hypothetical protein
LSSGMGFMEATCRKEEGSVRSQSDYSPSNHWMKSIVEGPPWKCFSWIISWIENSYQCKNDVEGKLKEHQRTFL